MGAGAMVEQNESESRPDRRRWRVAAIGGGAVIASVLAAHASGIPMASAGPVEAHASASPMTQASAPLVEAEIALPAHDASRGDQADEADAQRFTGRIGADLSAAMRAAGVPEAQGREYVGVLARAIPLANGLSVEDKFDLVIERKEDGSLGRLLYVGLDRVARADVELMKWTDGKSVIWVNGDGVGGEDQAAMSRPVNGRLTSGFGSRFHPILGRAKVHNGVDLAAAQGSPIVAAADGRVVSAGWHGGYGKLVAIAHNDGLRTNYGHMSRIAAAAGQMVRRGQVIGYVGSTGLSTGPHLHFEVTRNGRPINPMSAKFASGPAQLQGEKLQAFQSQLRQVLLSPTRG